MSPRGTLRLLLVATLALTAGCGTAERRAERYRIEQAIYQAKKAETEARTRRDRPWQPPGPGV